MQRLTLSQIHHPPLRHFPAAQAYLLSTGSWNTQTLFVALHYIRASGNKGVIQPYVLEHENHSEEQQLKSRVRLSIMNAAIV